MSNTHEVSGHQLTLLRNGAEYFPRLLAAIHAARYSIYFEAYIFAGDDIGKLLKEALESAAAREVDVHVLLDGFGSALATLREGLHLVGSICSSTGIVGSHGG